MAQSLPRHISKILLGIFLAFVLGVAVIGYRYYESQRRHIRQDYQTSLTAIAHLKVAEISQWRKERLSDGRSISENPLILDNLREIVAHRLPKQDLRKIAAWFQSYTSEHEYKCISLKNSRGNNLVGEDSESQISSRDIALIQEAVTTKVPIFSDLHHDADSTQVSMDMVFPIVARPTRDSAADAVVFLRIDAERNFYPMIRSWPEPAQTSEALLVERSGDEILYLNMPRYDKNPALSLKRPLSDTRLLGALALADSEGIAEGVDYRGVPVLGSLNKIPHSPWRLIAKIDLEEVYAQIRERLQMVVAFAIILICAAASGVGLIWKHQRSVYYRKNLELELKRRLVEQHFDQMMDHANDGIVIIDLEGRIVDANEKAMSLYGYSKGELPGRNISDTVALESRAEIQQRMTEVRKHNGMVFESIHQRKDDSRFPVEVSSRVVEVEGHRFYQNIIRDISARKTAEEALRRVERRFRSLIENASDLIIVLSPEGTFVFASPSVERILGIPLDTLRQRRLAEFIHPDDRAATLTMQEHALKTAGRTFILEHRLKAANSGWLNLESLVKYVVSPDGGGELIINARDTTERTQADEALRFSEEKFSKAFLTSPDAISINRLKDGKFLEVNDGFVNLTGYSREEVLGRSSVEINVWALPGDRGTFVKQLVKTGELEDFEADFLLKDGSRRVGLVSGKIMDVQNEPWILSITRDITERKRAEKFLVENEERMRVALKGANIAVFNQGPDLRYTWIYNPMMGPSANHAIGKTDWEIHPASKGVEKIVALKESVLKSGRGA
ncbi:MAG TPA: PAS domain S-box protein, partial [Bacteroidota bacterium]